MNFTNHFIEIKKGAIWIFISIAEIKKESLSMEINIIGFIKRKKNYQKGEN